MSLHCVVLENIHTPPPSPATEGNGNLEGRGGGSQKEAISEGVGVAYRGFFLGGLSTFGELLINNSFSVEQAITYFIVTGVSKQVLLFGLTIRLSTFG